MRQRLTLLAASTLLFAGCSRPNTEDAPSAMVPTPSAPAAVLTPSAVLPEAPSAVPSLAPVLTPEDAEDAAEHQITEQNLESELDRLEREIQAE
jgi:hypothetical protein